MWGTIYGAAVFIVMNFVVLPHTARLEITLVFAALAERGSRARVVSLAYRSPGQPDALQTSPASVLRRLKYKADRIDARGTWEITVLVAMPLQIGDTPDPE